MLVPVNWRLAGPEIAFIVNDAEAEILFVGAEFLDAVAAIRDQLASVREVVVTDRALGTAADRTSGTGSGDQWLNRSVSRPVMLDEGVISSLDAPVATHDYTR